MLVGVDLQEVHGEFDVKNFKATCEVTTLALDYDAQDANDEQNVRMKSFPLLGTEGQQFEIIIGWKAKKHISFRQWLPDQESKLDVSLGCSSGDRSQYIRLFVQLLNVDPSKHVERNGLTMIKLNDGDVLGMSASGMGVCLREIFDGSLGWLLSGTLRIKAKLLVAINDQTKVDKSEGSSHQKDLSRDWGFLFQSGEGFDVIIRVKGEDIHAHSLVLKTRSNVFAAALSSPMRESAERVIVIDDLELAAVKATIAFLYSSVIDADVLKSNDTALGILGAAHRYNIPSLEHLCVQALGSRIDVEVAAEWFHVADLIGNADFRALCLNFIRGHIAEVQGTDQYADFIVKRPALLAEILASLFPPLKKQRIAESEGL